MAKEIKTIGVLTSGGDAPGMNAAVRAVVRTALGRGLSVKGIMRGYHGLLNEEIKDMVARDVSDIIQKGGTILGTARCMEFTTAEGQEKGAEICKKHGIDGIVVIGGDGSYRGAQKLARLGINTIGVPGTIDLDISCTDYTIGFHTALNTVIDAIDRLRDTTESHNRCSVVEVMGHGRGDLALYASVAGGGTACWINDPENRIGFNVERDIIYKMRTTLRTGKHNFIVVVSEGITDVHELAKEIQEKTGVESRATILGHIQRGGEPCAFDRILASRMGFHAVELLEHAIGNRVIIISKDEITDMNINEALEMPSKVNYRMLEINSAINI